MFFMCEKTEVVRKAEKRSNGVLKLDAAEKRAEVVIKKKFHDIEEKAARAQKIRAARVELKRSAKPKGPLTPEEILMRAMRQARDERRVRMRERNLREGVKLIRNDSRIFIAIRNSEKDTGNTSRALLQAYGLTRPYHVAFVPNDRRDLKNLKILNPLVFYGHPTPELVRKLLVRRARFRTTPSKLEKCEASAKLSDDSKEEKVKAESSLDEIAQKPLPPPKSDIGVPVSDNLMVEERFADEGLLSVEDMAHEIYTCGAAFPKIAAELLPMALDSLKRVEGVGAKERRGYTEEINDLVLKVL